MLRLRFTFWLGKLQRGNVLHSGGKTRLSRFVAYTCILTILLMSAQEKLKAKRVFAVPQLHKTNFIAIKQIGMGTFCVRLAAHQTMNFSSREFVLALQDRFVPVCISIHRKCIRYEITFDSIGICWRHDCSATKDERMREDSTNFPIRASAVLVFSLRYCPKALVVPSFC